MRHATMAWITGAVLLAAGGRAQTPPTRVLLDFENDADVQTVANGAEEGLTCSAQQDYVTSGKRGLWNFPKGRPWCVFYLRGALAEGWDRYDYFAMDVEVPNDDRTSFQVELWDQKSINYATRCTLTADVVPGRQTVLIPINRAKRNAKEGISWEEATAADRIDRAHLKYVKIFATPPKDHDLLWRVDNLRLLTEDALGLSMELKLPAGAVGVRFGKPRAMEGFTAVAAGDPALSGAADLQNCGKHWPDPLTGDGVYSPGNQPFAYELALPDGAYNVWLAAGPVLRADAPPPKQELRVGDQTLVSFQPALADYHGTGFLYRFMETIYSEREHAPWHDFISRMYPVHHRQVKVAGGKLRLEVQGHQLSALIAVPAAAGDAAFAALCATLEKERIRLFEATQKPFTPKWPTQAAGDGDLVAFIPDEAAAVTPFTGPTAAARERKTLDLEAAPGQSLIFRVAVQTFAELGPAAVEMADLKGPGTIAPTATTWYLQNSARRGVDVVETALLPRNSAPTEKGLTRCFWAWMKVPADAKPGTYQGVVRVGTGMMTTQQAARPPVALHLAAFPVTLRVLPIQLVKDVPYAFGMWYGAPKVPDAKQRARVTREQLEFMRAIGFTGVELSGPNADGRVDTFLWDLAKEVGLGTAPGQLCHTAALGMGRSIGRARLGLGATVDRQPGSELRHPGFREKFAASARTFAAFQKACGLNVAVQTVDEPREMCNPWNRNLEDTNLYGDYLAEAGVANRYTTPMGDKNQGKDYTSLVDHHDIIATHAGTYSEQLMTQTLAKGKTLWIYNIGMDRLGWGFYNWRAGSKGRWEWHFCWGEGAGAAGYLNEEWYNPFTSFDGYAPAAPYATCPGAMRFKSVYLTAADGITDTAYLVTLEAAMAAAKAQGGQADAVARAEAFLKRLRDEIPFLPDVEGLGSAADGALVGQGLKTPLAGRCESWRREAGGLIAALQRAP